MSKLQIGQIFRTARPYKNDPKVIDGFVNHFAATYTPNQKLALMERGINSMASLEAVDGARRPAILIRSAPHKIGSHDTPWKDTFDVNNGHIHYYGDNKQPGKPADSTTGNKALLYAFEAHSTTDENVRLGATPLIFYRTVPIQGKQKGYIEFNGCGIIRDVQLITQYDRAKNRTFSNYAFNFTVFALKAEDEEFDWGWISARRDKTLSLEQTNTLAPASWQQWVKDGVKSIEKCRRRVSKLVTLSTAEQKPGKSSKEDATLREIYNYYDRRKARFEALAATVTERVIQGNGGQYRGGWITAATSDGGADFYGRLDVGSGFGQAKLIVLGQAKCEGLNSPTGGNHIARTVARLRRGWMGVYVTTSYFSEAVQREIIEDEYPILLINGLTIAQTVLRMVHDGAYASVQAFLQEIDSQYEGMVKNRRPEELLLE
jgi:hypothetical protein